MAVKMSSFPARDGPGPGTCQVNRPIRRHTINNPLSHVKDGSDQTSLLTRDDSLGASLEEEKLLQLKNVNH